MIESTIKNILGHQFKSFTRLNNNNYVVEVLGTSLQQAAQKIVVLIDIDVSVVTANGTYSEVQKSSSSDITIYVVDALKGTKLITYPSCA